MLQNKDIKNLSELKTTFLCDDKNESFFTEMISILKIGKHHAIFSSVKEKGISVLLIIKIFIIFPFIEQKNVHQFVSSYWQKFTNFGKDVYYRLKNNPQINWRTFLLSVVKRAIVTLSERESSETTPGIRAFIFDDTTILKTGILTEGVSKVWNHVIQKAVFGYQLLVMGFYDGTMFIPIDFSFHREKGKNKKYKFGLKPKYLKKQFKKKRDKKSQGYLRKKELDQSKISMVVKMIKSAIRNGITSDYVITDSWFTCWELLKTAIENNMIYIGMFSKSKTLFLFNKKKLSYKSIRKLSRKNIKRNRKYNLYYIRTVVEWNGTLVVLYFTRKGKNGNWKTILNTDLSSNFNETIDVYQLRWSIEVFFKEAKQLLNLGKSESQDFDAQIADATITMIQYIFLAIKNRIEKYESIGKLYENTKADMLELRLHERLILLLIAIIEIIEELFEQFDIEKLFSKIINNEAAFERIMLLLKQPENSYKKST